MNGPRPPTSSACHIVCLIDDPSMRRLVLESLATSLPGFVALALDAPPEDPGSVVLPANTVCLVVTATAGGASGPDVLRALRDRVGGEHEDAVTPVVLITDDRAGGERGDTGAAAFVTPDGVPRELGRAVVDAMASVDGGESEPVRQAFASLREAQRMDAAGRATRQLRHALNNPLAALLAEAQLLELEEITADQRQAVERMVELCRRMVAIVGTLDGAAGA